MSCEDLIEAVRAVGPAPCDGCEHRVECGDHRLACRDFYLWFVNGPIQHQDRLASRLWFLRADEDEDTPEDASPAYWRGVKDACDSKADAEKERDLAVLEDIRHPGSTLWYRAGVEDVRRHDVGMAYRWKRNNKRPTIAERRGGLSMRIDMNASSVEAVAAQVGRATEPVAIFWLGGGQWEVLPASKKAAQNRIAQDPRSVVGVFAPNCPMDWLLDSLIESKRA